MKTETVQMDEYFIVITSVLEIGKVHHREFHPCLPCFFSNLGVLLLDGSCYSLKSSGGEASGEETRCAKLPKFLPKSLLDVEVDAIPTSREITSFNSKYNEIRKGAIVGFQRPKMFTEEVYMFM
jgi:hypothetical protein